MKLIGYERQVGTYEGHPYDNTKLYCVEDLPEKPEKVGQKCYIYKAKTPLFLASQVITGDKVLIAFDCFGNVMSIAKEG